MIEEAFQYVARLANESLAPKTVHETRNTRTVKVGDADPVTYEKDFPARKHGVETLVGLVELANRFSEDGRSPVVWYNEQEVCLVINDGDHRDDTVRLKLAKSGLFKAIEALDPRTWYLPKEFIRLLRIDLFGALEPITLLQPVRKVQFDAGSTTKVENTRVRESMGKEISASVSAASELPEYVSLMTSMFTNPGVETTVTIKAAVEVDPNRQAFQIVVLPDELDKAKAHVMRSLADILTSSLDAEIPAYQGSPA